MAARAEAVLREQRTARVAGAADGAFFCIEVPGVLIALPAPFGRGGVIPFFRRACGQLRPLPAVGVRTASDVVAWVGGLGTGMGGVI